MTLRTFRRNRTLFSIKMELAGGTAKRNRSIPSKWYRSGNGYFCLVDASLLLSV